jgi:hypothetical protein
MNPCPSPFAPLPFKDRWIWVCMTLQMLAALGLLALILASWPHQPPAAAAPPDPDEGPPSIRSVEDPMLISPSHTRPARIGWM